MQSEVLLYRLWAKTNERQTGPRTDDWTRHPLPLHLLDVGLVADVWLERDSQLIRRFCTLWPGVSSSDLRRAIILAAAAHDLGKAYPDFQAKSANGWRYGYGQVWTGAAPTGRRFDHGAGTGRILSTLAIANEWGALPSGVDPAWLSLLPLIRISAGHHGTLFEEGRIGYDDAVIGKRHFKDLVAPLLDELARHFGAPPQLPPDAPPNFLLLLAGFVSVADWIGSDTGSFPPAPDVTCHVESEGYLARHRRDRTVERALDRAGLLAQYSVPGDFAGLFSPDGERWAPHPGFQTAACSLPFGRSDGPEIAVIEAPMGLGKTEIALSLAADALRYGTASGLYVALPTQATSNALFGRVARFGQRVVGDGDLALVLAHGAKRYFSEYRELRERTNRSFLDGGRRVDPDDPTPAAEVVAPAWVQPSKRALLAPLGLGTIDQALLGAMGVKHGFVRMFGLARKVVILDEVHAYDVYMGTILEHLLQWLGALGAKVILLSATLPSGLRARLLSAFGATTMDIPDAYPVLIHGEGGSPATVVTDPSPETTKRTTLTVEVVEATGDDEALTAAGTAWVVERVRQGGCAAWIRNTVRDAQSAYEALRKLGVEADLLHARFTRHDRGNKEEELLRRYGPPHPVNPARPVARVVIATQVIEQSVDVDFDVMLSDLAPMDLLLQRAGRMHRHERGGLRHGHEQPVLGVLLPDRDARHKLEFGRSAYVYDAETLARSAHLVLSNPTMTLPAACRTLVALLYDCDHSFWNADRLKADKGALDAARERLERHRTMMESTARRTLLTAPDQVPVMRDPFNDRSDAGEHVALATRYGAHTAAAVLFHDSPDGPVPLGARTPIAVPGEDDWRVRLDAEEAIALASVSFPWYGQRPDETPPPALLAPIHDWWRETHPFDDRLFVLLDDEGAFSHHSVEGRYDSVSGLTVARTRTTHAAAEPAPLEDL